MDPDLDLLRPAPADGGALPAADAQQSDETPLEPDASLDTSEADVDEDVDPYETTIPANPDDKSVDPNIKAHPFVRFLLQKSRRLEKQVKGLLPKASRVKDVDLDDLNYRARSYDALQQQMERNPRLRTLVHGDEPARGREAADELFDPTTVPLDLRAEGMDTPINRHYVQQAAELHETKKALSAAVTSIRRIEGVLTGTHQRTIEKQWQSAVETASSKMPAALKRNFEGAVFGVYERAKSKGELGRVTPAMAIQHFLADYQEETPPDPKAVQHAADRARVAQQNRRLPAQMAGRGTATTAQRRRENVAQLNQRLLRGG